MTIRWMGVCLDCADARGARRLLRASFSDGRSPLDDGDGWLQLRDPSGGVGLNIQGEEWYEPPVWPERPGAQTKMMHFEILVDDVEAAVAHASRRGRSCCRATASPIATSRSCE